MFLNVAVQETKTQSSQVSGGEACVEAERKKDGKKERQIDGQKGRKTERKEEKERIFVHSHLNVTCECQIGGGKLELVEDFTDRVKLSKNKSVHTV